MHELSQRLQGVLADRYRIERVLGHGGMATVFLAEDLKHRRRVAIKVLAPEVAAVIGPERFLREIETVARLTHPHILPLHDSGIADGLLFYVMPYVEGESLRDRLKREKQLPLEDALRIAHEVADALGSAHSRGVVHRDIKPENILLQEGHAVVADFGIARAAAAVAGGNLTGTGVAVGTPAYMSPEQVAGSRDLDGRADLYSLGCVLYEMLAGVPPFAGTTAESLAHQHLNVTPRPVTELRPAVPAAVAAALQRALAKAPADRFNPVALFGEALGQRETPAVATPRRSRSRGWLPLVGFVVAAAAVAGWWVARTQRVATPAHGRADIAVLPFQNLSPRGPDAYFAGGLHEELLTQLAKVAALKVISRTSVMGYEDTKKPLRQIAAELGVGSIVEGSVQVAGSRLRVNVQLIDAKTDEHLWAERYDRTLDDAFAIQSDVAQQIVAAVGAALGAGERQAIANPPTADAEAYRLYLQGETYRNRPGSLREDLESAERVYEQAVTVDPGFALAHAALSRVHGQMHWIKYDPSAARKARQREEALTALRLAPGLPEAHQALGMVHYQVSRDYRRALAEFQIAQRGRPNDASLLSSVGFIQRRLGAWAAVDSVYLRVTRLDPANVELLFDLGGITFMVQHRYPEAVQCFDRALLLAPDLREARLFKGMTYVEWKGDLDTLRAALNAMPRDAMLGASGSANLNRVLLQFFERHPDSVLTLAATAGEAVFESQDYLVPASLFVAQAQRLRGDEPAARRAFARALITVDSVATAQRLQDDLRVRVARGLALAGLGRRAEALREARWLEQTAESRGDMLYRSAILEQSASIRAQAGDANAALDVLEHLLSGPSWLSVHTLRLDPRWDPIRQHARFKALLVEHADPGRPAR